MLVAGDRGFPIVAPTGPGRPVAEQSPHRIVETPVPLLSPHPVWAICNCLTHGGVERRDDGHSGVERVHIQVTNKDRVPATLCVFILDDFPADVFSDGLLVRRRCTASF